MSSCLEQAGVSSAIGDVRTLTSICHRDHLSCCLACRLAVMEGLLGVYTLTSSSTQQSGPTDT